MAHEKNHDYAILPPSIYPLATSVSLFIMLTGAVLWMKDLGPWMALIGLVMTAGSLFSWWYSMVQESLAGENTPVVRIGLREGFLMFIVSEIFFFLAWFWVYFKNAIFPMEALDRQWPPAGIEPFDPWHLPLINTLILLLSGTFVTWAHHALGEKGDNNDTAAKGIGIAVLLGIAFTMFQLYEYSHATFVFGESLYADIFFMATGFHGFHVVMGTIFLFVCFLRARAHQFKQDEHVGFEAAAWYWHFVDVVWIFLFCVIYVWQS